MVNTKKNTDLLLNYYLVIAGAGAGKAAPGGSGSATLGHGVPLYLLLFFLLIIWLLPTFNMLNWKTNF